MKAGIVSRILDIIIAIILLIALPAAAEDMSEWNDDFEYSYGMQIYDHEGLIIYVTNGMTAPPGGCVLPCRCAWARVGADQLVPDAQFSVSLFKKSGGYPVCCWKNGW